MIENEYRKMQVERNQLLNRSSELNEMVNIKSMDIDTIVDSFKSTIGDKISELRNASATDTEIFTAIRTSMVAIGFTKSEAGIITNRLMR